MTVVHIQELVRNLWLELTILEHEVQGQVFSCWGYHLLSNKNKLFLYTTCGIGSCLTQLSRSETGPGSPLPHTWGISHNHSLQITTCTVWLCHWAIHSSNFFPSKTDQVLTKQRLVCQYTEGAAGFLRDLQQLSAALTEWKNRSSSASHEHRCSYSITWISAVQTKPNPWSLWSLNFCICVTVNIHVHRLA